MWGAVGAQNPGLWRGQGEAMGILVTAIHEPVRSVPGLSPEFPLGSAAVR